MTCYTAKQLSEMLGVTERKLAMDRFKLRGIPFVKLGRTVICRQCDVEVYLESNLCKTGTDK